MNSVTISATKNTHEKTFTVGERYNINISGWIDAWVECIEIDKQIVFKDLIKDEIYRSPTTQFDRKTSTASLISEIDSDEKQMEIMRTFDHWSR